MMHRIAICAAALLVGSNTLALAQATTPEPPKPESRMEPGGPGSQGPGGDQEQPRAGQRGGPEGRGPGGPGPRGHGPGHPPPMRSSTGFELSLGEGYDLTVRCGETPLNGCLNTAKPLIDTLTNASGNQSGDSGSSGGSSSGSTTPDGSSSDGSSSTDSDT